MKYLMLVLPIKPLITFIAYPNSKITGFGQDKEWEAIGYHIDNIFEYKNLTFLYAFILILILYLFIEGKNFTSNSRIKKLKKLLNQGVLTQEEFNKKLQEIKEEELKKV